MTVLSLNFSSAVTSVAAPTIQNMSKPRSASRESKRCAPLVVGTGAGSWFMRTPIHKLVGGTGLEPVASCM